MDNNTTYFNNTEKLYNLCMLEEMDDKEYMREVLEIFLSETPKDLNDMKEALHAGNTDTVCKKAHQLKSSAGIIQAHTLTALLDDIETLGKKGATCKELNCLVENAGHQYNSIEKLLKLCVEELK